jgi:hypothetical protein
MMNDDPRRTPQGSRLRSQVSSSIARDVTVLTLAQWDQDIAYLQHQRLIYDEAVKRQTQSPGVLKARRKCRAELADELRMRRRFERQMQESMR